MSAKCLALMLLVPCAALHLDADVKAGPKFKKPKFNKFKGPEFKGPAPNMLKNQETCALTFASHGGFGNQLKGSLGAGYIAKITGCTLVIPPVLTHGDTDYGNMRTCKRGIQHEQAVLNSVAPWYNQSSLQFTHIFELNTEIASSEPLTVDPRQVHFLPAHCKLWNEMDEDEEKYAKYLKDFIKNTDPKGSYTIGSGLALTYQGSPSLEFNELVKGFSPNLAEAVSAMQDNIAKVGKAEKGDYACVHLRSKDKAIAERFWDTPLKNWVKTNMVDIGSKPLLVISSNLPKNVEDTMETVCSKKETECLDGEAVMPEANYGFPDGRWEVSNKKLLIEMATCALAQDVYLPSRREKILIGNVVQADAVGVVGSTFSDVIAFMARSEQMQASAKQLVEVKAEKNAEKKARLSVKKTKKGKKNQKGKEENLVEGEVVNDDQQTAMSEELMEKIEQAWDAQKADTEADKLAIMRDVVAEDKAFKTKVSASTLAMVYVAETSPKPQACKCLAAQLNESPYKITRVKATTPEACYAKKGVKAEDQKQRSAKCTHYSALQLAYKNSLKIGNKFSIIFEDETMIKKQGFWQKVDKFLQSPCQDNWNYTSIDTKLAQNPWDQDKKSESSGGDSKKMCSWSKKETEAILPKVRMAEGEVGTVHIVRNSNIPAMLKVLDEEEKRDLPWKSVVNNFEGAATWLPQIAAHYSFTNKMGWKHGETELSSSVCSNAVKGTDIPVDAATPKAFEC